EHRLQRSKLKINVDETACWEKCGKSFRKFVASRISSKLILKFKNLGRRKIREICRKEASSEFEKKE
ncbi:MAG: hypothetical protein COW37_01020, partial [Caldiserica bacterium CG17_big_fil_post_rev_8_21_14_2_50_35_7]